MVIEQRITAIEAQEKRGNRRSIFLNGEFALGVDEAVIADLGLHIGQQISETELQEIVRAELIAKAKERALTLLDYRQRSKAEITRRLTLAGFAGDIIEEVMARLKSLGLVDDAQFSKSWVDHRLTGKPMGKTRIRWELRQKGVPVEIAEEALSGVDADVEYQSAMEAARRRWEKDNNPDQYVKRRKLSSYLSRQGFPWETISKVTNELAGEIDDD